MGRDINGLTAWISALLFVAISSAQQEDGLHPDAGDVAAQNAAGASGAGSGSNLSDKSRNVIIALSVVAGVVVIFGLTSAVLYVVAKRRQWAVREKLRQSARKVTDKVLTPLTPRFPRSAREPKSHPLETPKIGGHRGTRERNILAKTQSTSCGSTRKNQDSKQEKVDLERGDKMQSVKNTNDDDLSAEEKAELNSSVSPPKRSWDTRLAFWRR